MSYTRERVYYVYGFVRTEHCPENSDELNLTANGEWAFGGGFNGNDLPRIWRWKCGISAIICTVDNEDFCFRGDDIKISSLARLAPRMVKHQSVLEKAMKFGPILPLHFGTLFDSAERMDAFLVAHEATISGFLEQIEGMQEWAVQGYLDAELCENTIQAGNAGADFMGSLPPMAEMLRAELKKRDIKDAIDDWTIGKCAELFESLIPLASNSSECRLLPRNGSVDGCEMVVNWAFLVHKNDIGDFHSLVERVSAEFSPFGLSFHLSGPWPPYSFSPTLEEE